jgi:hypothetical protein
MDYSLQKYGPHDTKHVPSDLKEVRTVVLLLILQLLLLLLLLWAVQHYCNQSSCNSCMQRGVCAISV